MAKGKKKKGGAADKPAAPEVVTRLEQYLDVGNFGAIQRVAHETAGEPLDPAVRAQVDAIVEKIRTDPMAWAVGVGAFLIAVVVALATLGG